MTSDHIGCLASCDSPLMPLMNMKIGSPDVALPGRSSAASTASVLAALPALPPADHAGLGVPRCQVSGPVRDGEPGGQAKGADSGEPGREYRSGDTHESP